ncbi:hypothetical protein [Paenibacillus sp. SYP-B3998]|uniref:hypothetical protein n=1 Tax=Paenibacillus sp. SYP-B3998 TaxID=2678564 RepID=UPI0013D70930|nr:hypothetical protein [Paenibacillus sp. SYP-B3998]
MMELAQASQHCSLLLYEKQASFAQIDREKDACLIFEGFSATCRLLFGFSFSCAIDNIALEDNCEHLSIVEAKR